MVMFSPKLSQYGTTSIHSMDYLPAKENNYGEMKLSACISIKILVNDLEINIKLIDFISFYGL